MSGLVGKRDLPVVPGLGEVRASSEPSASAVAPGVRSELGPVPRSRAELPCCEARRCVRTAFAPFWAAAVSSSAAIQRSTQNWHGLGESDSLIKTKHCDGPSGC